VLSSSRSLIGLSLIGITCSMASFAYSTLAATDSRAKFITYVAGVVIFVIAGYFSYKWHQERLEASKRENQAVEEEHMRIEALEEAMALGAPEGAKPYVLLKGEPRNTYKEHIGISVDLWESPMKLERMEIYVAVPEISAVEKEEARSIADTTNKEWAGADRAACVRIVNQAGIEIVTCNVHEWGYAGVFDWDPETGTWGRQHLLAKTGVFRAGR